jgi:GWxTD domain-containing protein
MSISSRVQGTVVPLLAALGLCIGTVALAQSAQSTASATVTGSTLQSLPREYQRWLDEDVHWIITAEERDAFLQLSKKADRDHFIEEFWSRRDPEGGTEFKQRHYQRLAYVNEHFAADIPGWKTDRGRIFILYGPPDGVRSEPGRDNAGSSPKVQVWHYRSMLNYGKDIDLRFVDTCGCGDYRLATSPEN